MAAQPIEVELHTFRSALWHSAVHEAITFFNNILIHPPLPARRFIGVSVYALDYLGDFALDDYLAALNMVFYASLFLRTLQLELTVNLRSDAPGGPSWLASSSLE
jgi:hypothetical protein